MVGLLVAIVLFVVSGAPASAAPASGASGPAPTVLVHAPDGVLPAGIPTVLELVAAGADGTPIAGTPSVDAVAGQIGVLVAAGPGRWRFPWSGGTGPTAFDVRIGDHAIRVGGPVFTDGAPALAAQPVEDAVAGDGLVRFRFVTTDGTAAPPVASVDVRVSEGRVREVRSAGDRLEIDVEPGGERIARVLSVALLDHRFPNARPAWAVARLRARPQLSLSAEPGSTATLRVGRRTYGPFTADASGMLSVGFDVFPGESSYELTLRDDLGNTQRSQGPLAVPSQPVLVAVEAPFSSGAMPDAWLAAFTPSGQPWTASEPTCRGALPASVRPHAPGVWRVDLPAGSRPVGLDALLDCMLAGAAAPLRLPPVPAVPARLDMRVYPDVLNVDFPLAQAQVQLLAADGVRLPPEGVVMTAVRGSIDAMARTDVLNVEYRANAAVIEAGSDRLEARYEAPAASGPPWSVELHAASVPDAAAGEKLRLLARVRLRDGRPAAGAAVRFEVGGASAVDVVVHEAHTDARGWAVLSVDAPRTLVRVEAVAGAARASRAVHALGDPVVLPDPLAPDLSAVVDLPVRAGRVREIALDVSPQPLLTGPGARAVVTVRLRDAAGNAVVDEPVVVAAAQGAVGPAERQPDGSWRAEYVPSPGVLDGRVRLSAASGGASASTELRLDPRPVRGSAAVGVGWLTNFGERSCPMVTAVLTSRLPVLPELLSARVSVSGHVAQAQVTDPLAKETVDVSATLVPIELGVQFAQRSGRRTLEAGVGALVTPYRLEVDFAGSGYTGVAVGPMGMSMHGGAAWRLGATEVYGEARWMLIPPGDAAVSFRRPMGGATAIVGYRILW
jgi:hypothetical protein